MRLGDDGAFEPLYRRYHRRIASYIHGMVHDHARAEDITQDVFISALRRMRETDRPIAFKPWIYEIAKNACIDQFRRARRAEDVSFDAEDSLGSADYGRSSPATRRPTSPSRHKQQLDHLCGAFGGLSETHHEILVMRELEGLSYREIGERLGMTRPAVESTLFRARRRLTEEYDELVTGERCQRVQSIIRRPARARSARATARSSPATSPTASRACGTRACPASTPRPRPPAGAREDRRVAPAPRLPQEALGRRPTPTRRSRSGRTRRRPSIPASSRRWGKAAAPPRRSPSPASAPAWPRDDARKLGGALPTVSIESITGPGNPGGVSSDALRAGSGGGAAAGARASRRPAGRGGSASSPSGTAQGEGSGSGSRSGTTTTASAAAPATRPRPAATAVRARPRRAAARPAPAIPRRRVATARAGCSPA